MAWEEFERNGIKGMSGDRPIMAHSLITNVLLDDYCDGYYKDKADEIQFTRVKSNGTNGH